MAATVLGGQAQAPSRQRAAVAAVAPGAGIQCVFSRVAEVVFVPELQACGGRHAHQFRHLLIPIRLVIGV